LKSEAFRGIYYGVNSSLRSPGSGRRGNKMPEPCVQVEGWKPGDRPNEPGARDGAASAQDRSRREFEETALPHLDALYNIGLKLCRDASEAEDLVQETIVRAYRFFHQYERGTNCKAWLFKILRNAFINGYRTSRRRPEAVSFDVIEGRSEALLREDPLTAARNPEQVAANARLGQEVRAALNRLPPDFRMVVVLAFVEGYTYKEIATIMSCPIGTVMSRLFRARKCLQEALGRNARERGLGDRPSGSPSTPGRLPAAMIRP
jgi:RNA polymerase sigma-70 factor, ECF subfamily